MVVRTLEDRELRREFEVFQKTASRLEASYEALKARAAEVDRALGEANAALARTLAERERILAALPVGVFRRSQSDTTAENREAERLRAEIPAPLRPERTDAESGTPVAFDVVDRDGRRRSLRYQHVRLDADEDSLELVEDQTALVELQTEVARLDLLGSHAELALGIAHEMRNPLNGLAGFASMLRRNPTGPRAAQWAEKIESGARRLERIIRDLLAFARPGGAEQRVRRPLTDWLREAQLDVTELEVVIAEHASELSIDGARTALPKVFSNLFRNAEEAGATRVCVDVETRDRVIRVTIADNGSGVDPSICGRLFDPFVGTKESGSGLGLAYCARAMEAMGGAIRLAADATGARFELDFPQCEEPDVRQ